MKKIKTVNDFKKTINFMELGKVNDSSKFMGKSYLSVLLAGGKLREQCRMYAVRRYMLPPESSPAVNTLIIEKEMKMCVLDMVESFKILKKKKEWKISSTLINEYDQYGNEFYGEGVISRREEITTINTYFMDEPIDIEKLKK